MEPLIQIALSDKYLKTQNISKVIDVLRQYIMIEEHRKSICDSYKKNIRNNSRKHEAIIRVFAKSMCIFEGLDFRYRY